MEGVNINLDEFKRMKSIDRSAVLFCNQKKILNIFEDYKFTKKLVLVWLMGLSIFVGIKKFIGF